MGWKPMRSSLSYFLVFAVLSLAGCGHQRTPHAIPEQLKGRLDAALAINDMNQRDAALKSVAQDAAEAAEGEIVKRAVYEIHDLPMMDKVAYACALRLVERGQAQAAADTAKLMRDASKQNEVLSRIAKGGR
jgi:hypothetical protein